MPADITATIAAIYRIESTKIVARVARIVGDVGAAEELAQDALVRALEEWPSAGVPDNPGAWLMTAAKNKAIDAVRHRKRAGEKHGALGRELDEEGSRAADAIEAAVDDDIGAGRTVVCNVSRGIVATLRARYSHVEAVLVTAPADILAARLAGRSRETDGSIAARVARSDAFMEFRADHAIENAGAVDQAARRLLALIRGD